MTPTEPSRTVNHRERKRLARMAERIMGDAPHGMPATATDPELYGVLIKATIQLQAYERTRSSLPSADRLVKKSEFYHDMGIGVDHDEIAERLLRDLFEAGELVAPIAVRSGELIQHVDDEAGPVAVGGSEKPRMRERATAAAVAAIASDSPGVATFRGATDTGQLAESEIVEWMTHPRNWINDDDGPASHPNGRHIYAFPTDPTRGVFADLGSNVCELERVAEPLCELLHWMRDDAVAYVLTGLAPPPHRVTYRISLPPRDKDRFGLFGHRLPRGSHPTAMQRMILSLQPGAAVDDLGKKVKRIQDEFGVGPQKRDIRDEKHVALVEFFAPTYRESARDEERWPSLLSEWNRLYPEWQYADSKLFRSNCWEYMARALGIKSAHEFELIAAIPSGMVVWRDLPWSATQLARLGYTADEAVEIAQRNGFIIQNKPTQPAPSPDFEFLGGGFATAERRWPTVEELKPFVLQWNRTLGEVAASIGQAAKRVDELHEFEHELKRLLAPLVAGVDMAALEANTHCDDWLRVGRDDPETVAMRWILDEGRSLDEALWRVAGRSLSEARRIS